MELNIKSQFSIPESITKYEESITKTNSKIDYVVGIGLYMMPTDLVLKVGSIQRYNNNIVVAKEGMAIGHNENLNSDTKAVPIIVSTPVANVIKNGSTMSHADQNRTPSNEDFQVNNVYLGIGVTGVAFFISYIFLSK